MKLPQDMLRIGRVLHEDDSFVTMEIAKNDEVTFHLQQNDEGETVGGDQFFTIVFLRTDGRGHATVWNPFDGSGT